MYLIPWAVLLLVLLFIAAAKVFVPTSGAALRFNGDKTHRDYVTITPKCQADGNPFDHANLTLAVWFRTTTKTSTEQALLGYLVGQGPLISLGIGGVARFRGIQTSLDYKIWVTPEPDLTDGQWHHIALSTSPDYFAVYVDGQTYANCTGPMQQVTRSDRIVLGVYDTAFDSGNSAAFTGDLDDVRVYRRLFSTENDVFDNIMSRPPTSSELTDDLILAVNSDVDNINVFSIANQAHVPVSIALGDGLLQRSPQLVPSTAPLYSVVQGQNGPFIVEAVQDTSMTTSPRAQRPLLATIPHFGINGTAPVVLPLVNGNGWTYGDCFQILISYVQYNTPNAGTVYIDGIPLATGINIFTSANATISFEPTLGVVGDGVIWIWATTLLPDWTWQNSVFIFNSPMNIPPIAGGAGNAAQFDGVDDFYMADHLAWPTKQVDINGVLTRGLSAITIEFWSWTDASCAGDTAIFALGANTEVNTDYIDQLNRLRRSGRWHVALPSETNSVSWHVGNAILESSISTLYSGWTHYAFVHDGIEGTFAGMYINGQLIHFMNPWHDGLQDGLLDFNHVTIGTWTFWSEVYYQGLVDEFRIWNYSRTAVEIQRDRFHQLSGSEANLYAYWSFDSDDDGIVLDRTGRGNDLRAGGCVPCEPRFYCQPYSMEPITLGPESCIPSAKSSDSSRYRSGVCYGGTICFKGEERDSRNPTLIPSGAPIGGHTFQQYSIGGIAAEFTLNATDPDGDSLVFFIVSLPERGILQYQDMNDAWVTITSAPFQLPIGIDDIRLLSHDGDGGHPFAVVSFTASDGMVNSSVAMIPINLICPMGTFLNQADRRCDPCPAGSYSDEDSLDLACKPCPVNEFQPNTGQASCLHCTPGSSYTLGTGASSCTLCNMTTTARNLDLLALSTTFCSIGVMTDNESSMKGGMEMIIDFTSLLPEGLDPAQARVLLSTIPQYGKLYQLDDNGALADNFYDFFFSSVQIQEQYVSDIVQCSNWLPGRLPNATIGRPDVLKSGSSPRAWAPFDTDNGVADITVKFETAVYVTGVVIYENTGGGAVSKIEALTPSGNFTPIWTGEPLEVGLLVKREFHPTICPTNFQTDTLRLTVNSLKCAGRNEIDAIKMLGATDLKKSRNMLVQNPKLKVGYVPPTILSVSGGVTLGYKFSDSISYQIQSCLGGDIVTSGVQSLKVTLGESQVVDVFASKASTIAAASLSAIGIAVCILSSMVIHWFRMQPIIRASSTFFMHIMLVGMASGFLVLLLTAINAADPSRIPYFCMIRPFIFTFGFVLIMGSIIVKTARIVVIFELTKGQRIIRLTDRRLMMMISVLMLIDFSFVIGSWVVDPLHDMIVTTNTTRYHICASDLSETLINYSIAYKCILVLVGLALVIQGRNVPSTFNEVKGLSFMAYTIATNSIIYLIISGFVSNDPNASVIIMTFTMVVALFSTWTILVAFKFFIVLFRPDLNVINTSNGKPASSRAPSRRISRPVGTNPIPGPAQAGISMSDTRYQSR